MWVETTKPSKYPKRVLGLALLLALAAALLAAQLVRLTVALGDELGGEAARKLERTSWVPTVRGRILDRHGRVLAQDAASYDVAVDYEVISGAWATRLAGETARRAVGSAAWRRLSRDERAEVIERYRPHLAAHSDAIWDRLARELTEDRADLVRRAEAVDERVDRLHRALMRMWRWDERDRVLELGRQLTTEIEVEIDERLRERRIREQVEPHVIARRLDDQTGFRLLRLIEQRVTLRFGDGHELRVPLMPGVRVRDAGRREYPYERTTVAIDRAALPGEIKGEGVLSVTVEGVATQLLGWMSPSVQREDVQARRVAIESDQELSARAMTYRLGRWIDLGTYRPGDAVGRSGVEGAHETTLRGLRGLTTERVDTAERDASSPEAGQDVRLTLDVNLQARVQALMSPEIGLAVVQPWQGSDNPTMPLGTPFNGAAVVLDVDTGGLLAMVSTPTYTRERMRDEPEAVFADEANLPYLNRAVAARYAPGSIVKPLILCAAESFGQYSLDQRIECTGHFLENRQDVMRCWIYKRFGVTHQGEHGAGLSADEAIKDSCNIFFYTLGRRLGPQGIARAYRLFGLGERFGLSAGLEYAGGLGRSGDGTGLDTSDAIFMAMGQGPVDWTPLHAAEAYATLARGGIRMQPRLIDSGGPPDVVELGLSDAAVNAALLGLWRTVNEDGATGHSIEMGGRRVPIFDAQGVTVWGKTGTAEAPDLRVDPDGEGPEPAQVVRSGDHSWFVVLVGPEGGEPRYAIAVMMEYAGSGGRVSGPIANQIVHALIAEGYL